MRRTSLCFTLALILTTTATVPAQQPRVFLLNAQLGAIGTMTGCGGGSFDQTDPITITATRMVFNTP